MARLRHQRGQRCNSSTATGAFSHGQSSRERLGLRNVVRARDISQRNSDERPDAREHHVRLRLVVEVGDPANNSASVSAAGLDLERTLTGSCPGCGIQRGCRLDWRSRRCFDVDRIDEGGHAASLQRERPRPIANRSHWVEYPLRDPTSNERSTDREAMSRGGSKGAAGWTGDLVGTSMPTVSMRVVTVPPRFEGLPTASSQTVPLDNVLSLSHFERGRNIGLPFPDGATERAGFQGVRGRGIPGAEAKQDHGANGRSKTSVKTGCDATCPRHDFRMAPGSSILQQFGEPLAGTRRATVASAWSGWLPTRTKETTSGSGSWSQTGRGIDSKRSRIP